MTIEGHSNARTSVEGDIFELPVVLIPVKYFALPESVVEAVRIYLRIDVTVGHEQVRPAVVVDVDKERAPTQKLGVGTEPRDIGYVGEGAVPVVVIERGSGIGKVGPDDVQPTVAVIVDCVSTHASFFAPIFVVGHAGFDGDFRECAVAVVVK